MRSEEDTLRTSWTQIAQLKSLENEDAWREFYNHYRRLVLGVARKAGLNETDAEDVLQETMASVCKHIEEFEANPKRGLFRAWLMKMVRWRIEDQRRKRLPANVSGSFDEKSSATTPLLERVPNAEDCDLEGLCDAEWRASVLERAKMQLPLEVKALHYQIFHLLSVEQKSVTEVADILGISKPRLYLIRHRVGNTLKAIAKRLEARLG